MYQKVMNLTLWRDHNS